MTTTGNTNPSKQTYRTQFEDEFGCSSEDDGSDAVDGVTDGKSVTVSSKASSSNDTKHKKKSAAKHSVDVFCSMSKDDIANATSFKHCHGSGKKSWKCHMGNIKRHGVFV